ATKISVEFLVRRKKYSSRWAPRCRRNSPNGPLRHDCRVWAQSGSRPAAELLATVVRDNPFILQKPSPETGWLMTGSGGPGAGRPGRPIRVSRTRLDFNGSRPAYTPVIRDTGSGGEPLDTTTSATDVLARVVRLNR